MDSSGKVLDARGKGEGRPAREELREAVKRADRARAGHGRVDAADALELWQGLFSGRWSLVDHFENDGRRLLLARRNDPDAPGPAPLSRRQRQVLFYASAGWSNKEIGYSLGVAPATVATHLKHALAAIGVRSRAEWIRVAAELAQAGAPQPKEPDRG